MSELDIDNLEIGKYKYCHLHDRFDNKIKKRF